MDSSNGNQDAGIVIRDVWCGAYCLARGATLLRTLPQEDGRSFFLLSNAGDATYQLLQQWRNDREALVDGRAFKEAYSFLFHQSKAAHGQPFPWQAGRTQQTQQIPQIPQQQQSRHSEEASDGYGRDAA